MKILMICKALEDSYAGGIQTHVTSLTSQLIDDGHEVTILTAGNPLLNKREKLNNGLRIYTIPYLPKRFAFGLPNFLGEFSFNLMVKRWIKRNSLKFDIIHVQGRSGIMLNNQTTDKPIITTIHRLMKIESKWNSCDYNNIFDRYFHLLFASYFESKIMKVSSKIITVSDNTKKEIHKHNTVPKEKVHIIPNGVYIPKNIFNESSLNTLLFVGRLTKVKGTSLLIDAMRLIDNKIKLIIIGEGPCKDELKNLITKNNLEDRVILLGSKSRHEVYKWMLNSKALVLPSYHESQGIVMLEANAHSLPVIATKTSGILEFIDNGVNGILFKKGCSIDMAEAINTIFAKPELASLLGSNGRKKMNNEFQWSAIAKSTLRIYNNVA